MRHHVEGVLNDSQFGFRPGRSTMDPIFIMKMLLEKSWEWGIGKYALFIDLEKAFDRVNRDHLWTILKEDYYNIPPKLIRVIQSIYIKCTSKVMTQKLESEEFDIKAGVRQGDVLFPLLFLLLMDKCLRDIGVGTQNEETLMYVDDVAVVANSADDIQNIANRWWRGMEQNGMKINTKKGKTKVMKISRDQEHQLDIFMGDDKLNQSEEYKYLGVMIGQKNSQELEINARIAKSNSNTALLYPLLNDEFIPRKSKLIIYQTISKPILLYGAEVWSLTSKTESSLQAAEMRVL